MNIKGQSKYSEFHPDTSSLVVPSLGQNQARFEELIILLRAQRALFMRGELSPTSKLFQIYLGRAIISHIIFLRLTILTLILTNINRFSMFYFLKNYSI